ncbi:unnamed protein product [Ceutorhynchus assimilis]|uniref:SWIM-type domain-containing protein n=1 Tax=Ceutorhynchus assimilis TaxID=467358 RepID=A0A9N9MGZ7_9CUCU|nr:unnamed protein product [Ceutorhynchus assimilis]
MKKVDRLCWIVFLMQLSQLCAETVEIQCPEFCTCDVFQNLKRASCQHRRLVSMELNIPPQAEILDMSNNQIRELADRIFLQINLTDLKLLNLSYNKIRQIHFNGFEGLENLKSLDLSFNAVEYFTQSWFQSLKSLEEFYLRGNILRSINDQPPIEINSLKVLDISKCGITKLDKDTLKFLPNLKMLDISENFIQIIKVDILKTLPKLTNLQTNDNNFNCKDDDVIEFENYAKSKNIIYTDSCSEDVETFFSINNILHKFEKMQMSEDINDSSSSSPIKNSWIFDDNDNKITKCINSTGNVAEPSDEDSLLVEIINLSPLTTMTIVFVYGVLCGMLLTCAISLCAKRPNQIRENIEFPESSTHSNNVFYTSLQEAKRRLSREILDNDSDDGETLVMNEFQLSNSTPVPGRRGLELYNKI